MPAAKNYKSEERIFALCIGRSGDGKSVAESQFPRPLLTFDFDYRFGGVAAAAKVKMENGKSLLDLDGIEYRQYAPKRGFKPVDTDLEVIDTLFRNGQKPYATIVIDSLTALTRLMVVTSHTLQDGRFVGSLRISGPADFNFEQAGTHQCFDFLKSFPCNILCSAHIVDRYGRVKTKDDPFPMSSVIGEKLSIRDNLGENVLAYFDNVFKFSRDYDGSKVRFYVEFSTDLAKNIFGIPPGKHDITGKNFYAYLQELITKYR
jgi:hypothetical protein